MPPRTSRKTSPSSSPGEDADLLSRMVAGSPDCIKVLDLDGRLLSMNAGGMRLLEICDFAPLVNSQWIDFWKGADRDAAASAVTVARAGGVGRFVGFFPTTQTQRPMWFDVMVSPILGADGKPEKLLAASREVTEWKRSDRLLQAIINGTASVSGHEFFRVLVEQIAAGLGVRYSFVAECLPNERVRSLAFWNGEAPGPQFEYDLRETPCWRVIEGQTCHYESGLQRLFPKDAALVDMRAESYLGVPLRDSRQRVIGHLVAIDERPMAIEPLVLSAMETFAARAALELERARAFEQMKSDKEESEARFRDLFDEAPIAYVNEGLDSKFIRANKTALKTLGITEADVATTYGKDFIPNTPDAQRRLKEAFESIGKGIDTSGVVLELRRRDNGKPLWIQWWSRPDPSGTFTRTMFVDITDRVMMERERARLEAQNVYLQEEIRSQHNFVEIIGNSPALLAVLRQVDQFAATDATALIFGETGTGKELIARAIHDRSPRRDRPLVKVNCGAISAGLVESELFGHVKGAFTGAISNREGRFALADGGTIFLDEVGELPLETQVKLLRVLQEQEFEPLGSSKTIKVDVRVIAATNRDLDAMVREGKFRNDLFYRLNVVPVTMPPLRDRPADIPLLAMFFLEKSARKLGRPVKHIAEETMTRLCAYSWPGNIRELQNVIERAVVLASGSVLLVDESALPTSTPLAKAQGGAPAWRPPPISRSDSPLPPPASADRAPAAGSSLEEVERQHILTVLERVNWRIEGNGGAAKILNLEPSTLRSRMKKLGIARS